MVYVRVEECSNMFAMFELFEHSRQTATNIQIRKNRTSYFILSNIINVQLTNKDHFHNRIASITSYFFASNPLAVLVF